MNLYKQSTAATVLVGPVMDSTGASYTGAVIGDFTLTKNGTPAAMAAAATATHDHNGHYLIAMTTGNVDTLGRAKITINKATYAMPPEHLTVLTAATFDALVTNAAATSGGLPTVGTAAGQINPDGTGSIPVAFGTTLPANPTAGTTGSALFYADAKIGTRGTAQAGSSSTITLAAGASSVDNAYKDHFIKITGGTGAGQFATITGYVGSTKVATISRPGGAGTWTTNPDNTSVYMIEPFPQVDLIPGQSVGLTSAERQTIARFSVGLPLHVYCVETTGNDSNTGLDPTAAWLTPSHAASIAVDGDEVRIGEGTFNDGTNTWAFAAGVKVVGAGSNRTILQTAYATGTTACFTVADRGHYEGFQVQGTAAAGTFQLLFGYNGTQTSDINFTCVDIFTKGETDGFYFNTGSPANVFRGRFWNCRAYSNFDTFAINGASNAVLDVYNPLFEAIGPDAAAGGATTRGIYNGSAGAIIRVFGGLVRSVDSGSTQTFAVRSQNSTAYIYLSGVTLDVIGATSTSIFSEGGTGVVIGTGCTYDVTKVSGTPIILSTANVTHILGTASQGAAGYMGIDWGHITGQATAQNLSATTISTSQVVASVTGATGSVTGLNPALIDVATSTRMATYTQPTGFLAATFPGGTVANTTNITAGTITTTTTLTTLPAVPTDWLTAAGVKADAVTKIQAGLSTFAANGNVTVAAYASGQDPAALVLDAAQSSHNTSGTIGNKIGAAASAGDPWTAAIPGSYGAGSAGAIVGNNLNATITSRSTFAAGQNVGAAASVTAPVTAGTVTDKTGYSLANTSLTGSVIGAGFVAAVQSGLSTFAIGQNVGQAASVAASVTIADGSITSAKFAIGTVNPAATGFIEKLMLLVQRFFPVAGGSVTAPKSGNGNLVIKGAGGTTIATQAVTDDTTIQTINPAT